MLDSEVIAYELRFEAGFAAGLYDTRMARQILELPTDVLKLFQLVLRSEIESLSTDQVMRTGDL